MSLIPERSQTAFALARLDSRERVNLDSVQFGPILKHVKRLLPMAERLSELTKRGDEWSAANNAPSREFLEKWPALESALAEVAMAHRNAANWLWTDRRRLDAAQMLIELACGVRDGQGWDWVANHLGYAARAVEAFVKPARHMAMEEADREGRRLWKRYGPSFFAFSERHQAKLIGCSWSTWAKTEFYEVAQRARPVAGKCKKPKALKTQSFTRATEAVTGEGVRDEVLQQLIDAETAAEVDPAKVVQQLIDEQNEDLARDKNIHFRRRA